MMDGFEVDDISYLDSGEFNSWPFFNPGSDLHNFEAAAVYANRIVAALQSADVDAFRAVAGEKIIGQVGPLTPENKKKLQDEMKSFNEEAGGFQQVSEIRRDESGFLFAQVGQADEGKYVVLLLLERTNGRYTLSKFEDMSRDEFITLPLLWKSN